MENETKKKVKNILFGIALLPYIIIIIKCVYYAITGYGYTLGNTAYGYVAIGKYLGDVFNDVIDLVIDFPKNLIAIPIIIMWVGYQIYYFITFDRKKQKQKTGSQKEIETDNQTTSTKSTAKRIIFYLCVACWCLYLASGIFAFFFGYDDGIFHSNMIYGIDALLSAYLWYGLAFSFIPVLPISLLYIIIYIIVNKRKKKKETIENTSINQADRES